MYPARVTACFCRLSLDARRAVADPPRVAVYDKLDWHVDSAVSAGQPAENAFTHIGFYLAWLIRHDLHRPRFFPAEHVDAVRRREMTGSDLADDVDTKLVSPAMNDEGRAFSDARYDAYCAAYEDAFRDVPDYGVVDDEANYARAEALLDGLYAEWVAAARPTPAPSPPSAADAVAAAATIRAMLPPGFSEDELADLLAASGDSQVRTVPPPTDAQGPHLAPELEALIPPDLTSPPMSVASRRATDWGSSLLNRALKRLETQPKDVIVVTAIGGEGEQTLTVTIYRVPGVSAERLGDEFTSVFPRLPGAKWEIREVMSQSVHWAAGHDLAEAFWIREGLVIGVAGRADAVERAIGRLG